MVHNNNDDDKNRGVFFFLYGSNISESIRLGGRYAKQLLNDIRNNGKSRIHNKKRNANDGADNRKGLLYPERRGYNEQGRDDLG